MQIRFYRTLGNGRGGIIKIRFDHYYARLVGAAEIDLTVDGRTSIIALLYALLEMYPRLGPYLPRKKSDGTLREYIVFRCNGRVLSLQDMVDDEDSLEISIPIPINHGEGAKA